MEAEKKKLPLLPDFEIRAIAQHAKAALLTYDNDFAILNRVCKITVELEERRHNHPASIKELLTTLRQNKKRFPENPGASISKTLKKSLEEELAKMPPEADSDKAVMAAMRTIASRIKNREVHLADLTNSGDVFALNLAETL